MNFINFPESNLPLGAGGNENTSPMRVCVCEHPEYKPGTLFYATLSQRLGKESITAFSTAIRWFR